MSIVVEYEDDADVVAVVGAFEGQLTSTVHGESDEALAATLLARLGELSGRVLWNDWPTGVAVTHAMQHGGPYPAATAASASVGTAAVHRFGRPVAYQGVPDALLPPPLQEANPWQLPRRVDGVWQRP